MDVHAVESGTVAQPLALPAKVAHRAVTGSVGKDEHLCASQSVEYDTGGPRQLDPLGPCLRIGQDGAR